MAKKETTTEKKTKAAAPKKAAVKVVKDKVAAPKKAAPKAKAVKAEKPVKEVKAKAVAPKKAVVAKKATAPKKAAVKAAKPAKEAKAKVAAPKKAVLKAVKPAKKAVLDPEKELVDAIVEGMLDKKGHQILVLDLRPTGNSMADWFVICHGNSNTQADAIADSVEDNVRKKLNIKPWHTEGFQNAEWILLDYVNVVVHVFQEPIRDFYRLEKLWADAPTVKIEESF
jgi:ribosome-associated protein